MIRNEIYNLIKDALSSLSLEAEGFSLEHPGDLTHGDYATNVALILAKVVGKNPRELAEEIAEEIRKVNHVHIAGVSVAGPGFINITLTREFFSKSIAAIIKAGNAWGANDTNTGKKVMVEYTDPNPFKELHIGHVMSNTIGESLARLMEYTGAEVHRANYQGDVGMHVAKAVWALREAGADPADIGTHGAAYAKGATAYKEDEKAQEAIREINKKVYDRSDSEINDFYDKGKEASLDRFERAYQMLGTAFDHYFFESAVAPSGISVVEGHPDIFEESDGARVFRGEKYGLHTRVFLNSEGLPTYEAKELGLAKVKYDTFPYDMSLVITGNEIDEYFKVLLKAMELVYPDLAPKTTHIGHGMMRLKGGKMSSRTGDVITAESFIDDVKEAVFKKMEGRDIPGGEKDHTATDIAVAAIKYVVLKGGIRQDIIFDKEQATSFEGDSGPHLQYAHTRAQSVLLKAQEEGGSEDAPETLFELERLLYRFPEIVLRAQEEREPHHVTTYLIALADAFGNFYAHERIVDAKDHKAYKIALVRAFKTTMQNGLWLLGIRTPEQM